MKNIYTHKNILLLTSVILLISCSNSDNANSNSDNINSNSDSTNESENSEFAVREYSFDTEDNSKLMFQDGEPQELMTSEERRYEIAKVVRVRPVDAFTVEVANFAPVDIEDIFITADIEGIESKIKLFKIKKIRAHAIQEIKYSFLSEETQFVGLDGELVDLSKYRTKGILADKVIFDFMGESELVKKLKTLSKLNWDIRYNDFNTSNNPSSSWAVDISAKDIRRFSALMINLGYTFVSKGFKEAFLKEHLVKNGGVIVMSSEEKKELYQKIMDKKFLKCGKTIGVGLGGGSTFGLLEGSLKKHIKGEMGHISGHEIGHCMGYKHSSNMTYPIEIDGVKRGFSKLTQHILNSLFLEKALPINTDNYYKDTDLDKLNSNTSASFGCSLL